MNKISWIMECIGLREKKRKKKSKDVVRKELYELGYYGMYWLTKL